MATPANRILVVYVDAATTEGQANASALDGVAQRGCSGFLILPDGLNRNAQSASLHALLGVDAQDPNSNGKLPYPKMPTAVFSDSQASCDDMKRLGSTEVTFISASESQQAAASRVEQLLHVDDSKTKQLVVVHLTQYRADHWIFPLVEKLLGSQGGADPSSDCFISIVRTAQRPHTVEPEVASHPLRPRQSHERHQGTYATSAVAARRLLFSSFHCDRSRCDQVTKFDESEIEQLGAYGAMDARIFMKEMAFRLGFAPKYGA